MIIFSIHVTVKSSILRKTQTKLRKNRPNPDPKWQKGRETDLGLEKQTQLGTLGNAIVCGNTVKQEDAAQVGVDVLHEGHAVAVLQDLPLKSFKCLIFITVIYHFWF